MRDENGQETSFFDWLRDLRVLVGVLAGALVAVSGVMVYGAEVLQAPQQAQNAYDIARDAEAATVENGLELQRLSDRQDDWSRAMRITFCTSGFDLSQRAVAELGCQEFGSYPSLPGQ